MSRLAVIRCVLAIIKKLDLETCQLDVKTAFLNGEINEDIFMKIPDGFVCTMDEKKNKVWKLKKSLYELKISPKRWNEKFAEVAVKIGLEAHPLEPCLFTWKQGKKILILVLYVDDMLIASNFTNKIDEVKAELKREFELTDLGEVNIFLGIKIKRDRKNKTLTLTQEDYTNKILSKFGFLDAHPQRTPMITNQQNNHQRKEREENDDAETLKNTANEIIIPYREAVGSLLYLENTVRSDIQYAVNVLSRHQTKPTEEEWKMVKRKFRYLAGTKRRGLKYKANTKDLDAFSDASFADCKNSLTTCGYLIRLFGDTVAWKTRKQSYVSLSTCQAEYIAMSEACKEVISINNVLKNILDVNLCPITLWCDNRSAAASAKTGGGS